MHRVRQKVLATSYRTFHNRVMKLLYEADPGGMGSTVGAPADEYSEEATKLIAGLKRAKTIGEVRRLVVSMFPESNEELVSKIYSLWAEYGKLLGTRER